jgi:hypothetical protein
MIKYMLEVLKYTGKMLAFLLLLILCIIFWFYLKAPVYDFRQPEPFSGSALYNPYEGLDSLDWHRANFQVQSRAWGGLTDGRKNSNEAIDSVYRSLQYEIIATSDYMKINRWSNEKETFIPVYEHGYGTHKWHQVVIGAHRVNWIDFPLGQNLSHKQYILDLLRENSELVYIAHPRFGGGYNPQDMTWLTGYTGMEVLNYFRNSIDYWDSALSAGRYVALMGNDDSHDISNPMEVGHRMTYIHSSSLRGDSIIAALKARRAYGADIFRTREETMQEKIAKIPTIARFRYLRLFGDTIKVAVDKTAVSFRFIGQGGKEKGRMEGVSEAWYVFRPGDTYIRIEIHFADMNVLHLNPVVRYNPPEIPGNPPLATVNVYKTWVYRVLLVASFVFALINVILLRRRFLSKTTSRSSS